ncbi:MAG: transposase [Candidatus Hadarchaeales archaeon]
MKLKLNIEPTELEEVMSKYSAAVNFYIKRCFQVLTNNRWLGKSERFQATCSSCGTEGTVVSVGSLGSLCADCRRNMLSYNALRKRFTPTKERRVPAADNVYLAARNLSPTLAAQAFQHAQAILKSWFALKKKRDYALRDVEKKLRLWKEVLEDSEVVAGEGKIKARVVVPPKGRQRLPRFKHVLHPENFKGRTLRGIELAIEKLERRRRALLKEQLPPKFRGESMWLHKNSIKFLDERRVKLVLEGKHMEVQFHALEVEREKSRDYLMRYVRLALEMQERNIHAYPRLLIENGSCFLEFPVRIPFGTPEPDETFGAVGIDRGVNSLIAFAAVNRYLGKPHHLWLASGGELSLLRAKGRLLRRRLYEVGKVHREQGKRFRLRRRLKSMKKESELSKHILHGIAKSVVRKAKELYPDGRVVIVMEKLEGLRPVKGKKHERSLNFKLSSFAYRRLGEYIHYKAQEEGIPVIFVPPSGTSTRCSKCGCDNPSNRSGGFFRCSNCGFQMNADLNAAINIANRFYENFKGGEKQNGIGAEERPDPSAPSRSSSPEGEERAPNP